jgi:hypothetical protein
VLQSFYDSEEYAAEMKKRSHPDSLTVKKIVALLSEAKRRLFWQVADWHRSEPGNI